MDELILNEIISQIIFWTEISKEHPIVINTVADLTNKDLPADLVDEVASYTELFQQLQDIAIQLEGDISKENYEINNIFINKLIALIKDFTVINRDWIDLLGEVQMYGRDDLVWQTLVQHITEEQVYAAQLLNAYSQMFEENM